MESSPPSESSNAFVSGEEFESWIRAHPENREYFVELVVRAGNGEFGEVPPEARGVSHLVLEKLKESERLRAVQRILQDFHRELQQVQAGRGAPDAIRKLHGRCAEVIDASLDLPEPHRADLVRELLSLQVSLGALVE